MIIGNMIYMNRDNSAFVNLAFNPENLETVLVSEVVDPEENLFKESLADLQNICFLKRCVIIFKILLIKIFLSYI